jgi:hypothetical protein
MVDRQGLGAYAGGTIAGSLTRRYHGLLIAPVAKPLGRRLIVAKADATVIVGARSWPLFTNRWKSGDITPAGHVRIGYFHGDNGRGCGASHQTGWTGLVANLIAQRAAEQSMEGDYRARTKQDEPGAVLSRPFPG